MASGKHCKKCGSTLSVTGACPNCSAIVVCTECAVLRNALEESVKLQSYYAALLNRYDNGHRTAFKNADEWLTRLKELKQIFKRRK